MSLDPLPRCDRPTMYFIGVSTQQSSIMRVFPRWADVLGLDAVIRGYDAPPGAPPEAYRRIVEHLRDDDLAQGALVTTHKIDLLAACRDLFDELDPHALTCGEVSSISKRDGKLVGHAKDPITSAAAWRAFVPPRHWAAGGEVLCLGAGGSAVALSASLASFEERDDRPGAITFVNRSQRGMNHLLDVHEGITTDVEFRYHVHEDPLRNDALMAELPPTSMVINATGMGKDRPGSPISDAGVFPERGLVWELNYRGALDFLQQARRQEASRGLTVEDGWVYFLHGWSAVIGEVFDRTIDEETFAALDRAASELRPA
jgi:shikimate dehydrogenase